MIESPHARHRHNVAAMIVVLIGVVVSLTGLIAVGLSVSPLSLNAGVQYEGDPLGTWSSANEKKDLFKSNDIQKIVDNGKLYVQIKSLNKGSPEIDTVRKLEDGSILVYVTNGSETKSNTSVYSLDIGDEDPSKVKILQIFNGIVTEMDDARK